MAAAPQSPKSHPTSPSYDASGVKTDAVEAGLGRLVEYVKSTWQLGEAPVKLDLGYFANVIDVGGLGIAICTDGIGTKALVAQMMREKSVFFPGQWGNEQEADEAEDISGDEAEGNEGEEEEGNEGEEKDEGKADDATPMETDD